MKLRIPATFRGSRIVVVLCLTAFILGAGPARRAQAQTLTVLHGFGGGTSDGGNPSGGLIMDASGNLYGTTYYGGAYNDGIVFKLDPYGTLTVLHAFTGGNDGAHPAAGLIMDNSGNLYGTTEYGGSANLGTVFTLPASGGVLATLAFFSGTDGAYPVAGLAMDSSGNLYGVTEGDGSDNSGTVFKLPSGGGVPATLAVFSGSNGAQPVGGLVLDSLGNVYGTTRRGGASDDGTVFQIPASGGSLSTLVVFSGSNGAHPAGGLILDSNGTLYGTTEDGGASNLGTVFSAPSGGGTPTVLHSFSGGQSDGSNPYAGLTMDASGNLFGTTYSGGALNYGTVFELANSSGSYSENSFYSFSNCGNDGAHPSASLIRDSSANLYGTAYQGGSNAYGIVFKLSHTSSAVTTKTTLTSSDNPATAGDNVILTAAITSLSGYPDVGSVTFSTGGTTLGTEPVSCGQSSFLIEDADALGIGTFTVTAQFTPASPAFSASFGTVSQVVNETGAATTGSNVFSGSQTVNGTVTATSFVGNGSQLTNITAQTANTANYATSAGTSATSTNALSLGGTPAANYARLDIGNSFVGNQSVSGSIAITGNASTAGSLTIGGGGTPILSHVSMLFQNVAFNVKLQSTTCMVWSGASTALPSAADGDTVVVDLGSSLMNVNIVFSSWAVNGGVKVRICNPTGKPVSLGSGNIRIDVWKH